MSWGRRWQRAWMQVCFKQVMYQSGTNMLLRRIDVRVLDQAG